MSARVCPDPACAELNLPDALVCHACGKLLIPRRLKLTDAEGERLRYQADLAWKRARENPR